MLTMRERPRSGQNRPESDHAVVRRHDQAVDLLVAVVGEREHRPVVAGLARAHLDAADDAVGAGRGRDLDAVAFGLEPLDRVGEVDRRGIDAHIDRLDGARSTFAPGAMPSRTATAITARNRRKTSTSRLRDPRQPSPR